MFGAGGTGFGGFGQQNQQNQAGAQPGQTGGGLFGAPQQSAAGTGFGGGFGAQPSTTFGGASTAGGGLFGQPAQQQQNQPSSGFTFGQSTNNAASTPFGQQAQAKPGFGGFGATTGAPAGGSFGGFGATQNNQNQVAQSPFGAGAAFGAKPANSLFGQQPQTNTFGQPAQPGGLFGGGLGASQTAPMPTQGSSNPPYDLKPQPEGPPDTPYDEIKKHPQLLNYTSITCMKAYRSASLEELRLQDYEQGRKTGNGPAGGGFGQSTSTGGFGAPAQTGGLFGQSTQQQPAASTGMFGANTNTSTGGLFGQQQQPQTGGGLFGQTQNTQQQQPATGGFGFGASQPQQQNAGSGFTFGQNNTQNKPAGGLFGGGGGFGATNPQAGASTGGFSFGGANNQTQPQPAATGFGGAAGGGFSFGASTANANQPKPGGLFGAPATSSAPTFGGFGASTSAPGATDNKAAPFSFGGGGFGSGAPAQTSTAAPTGGLFGSAQPTTTSQPTSGFTFGGASNNAGGATGGLFGGQQNQQGAGGFGSTTGGGLFGAKPATGGLFGAAQPSQPQQQPATGGFGFGATNTAATNTGGGLFGNNNQNKPAGGLFGGLNTAQQPSTGGLFGSTQNNTGTTGGGLFGSTQPGQMGGGGLFGSTNQQPNTNTGGGLFGSSTLGNTTGGFGLGGQQNNQQSMGSSLFGNSMQQSQQGANLQVSLNSNPYGTDALFGGQAGTTTSSGLNLGSTNGINSQPHLPFNVSLSRSSTKKQPPLVPPFRPSSRNSIRITKLRGSTPSGSFRETTPGREGTPGRNGNSLFTSSPAPPSSYQRLTSPSPSIFRGLSDDMPRSQRESSVPASLPPQAFVSRPSVKRLVLDDNRASTTGLGRSGSIFSARGSSTIRDESPAASASIFERNGTPARSHVNFSPALETAASSRAANGQLNEGDSSFSSTVFNPSRRGLEETPSKVVAGSEMTESPLPRLNRSTGKQAKEDALLPLDYWTTPALSELRDWSHAELQSVEGFVVGRKGFGQISFSAPVDLTTVGELSNVPGGIVILRHKECIVYPSEDELWDVESGKQKEGVQPGFDIRKIPGGKATLGSGLNVPALVRLERCWTFDRSTRAPVKDEEHIRYKQHINRLKNRQDAHFVDFEAEGGVWIFRVDHFSRYGLDETDEEDTDDDDDMEEEGGNKKKKKKQLNSTQRRDQGSSEDDDVPPPSRAIDERTDEEHSEAESDMRASELGDRQPTPKARQVPIYSRASTPASVTTNRSTTAGQPWAASLGLEARKVQVMQASFFGASEEVPRSNNSNKKQSRLASPSFVSSNVGSIASRANFLNPISSAAPEVTMQSNQGNAALPNDTFGLTLTTSKANNVRPRKFSRLELASSVVDGSHDVIIDAGLAMGRSFRVGWGPNGTFVHSGKWASSSAATSEQPVVDSISTVKVAKLTIFAKEEDAKEREKMESLLEVQLKHSIIEDDEDGSDCPAIYPKSTLQFQDFATASDGLVDSHYDTAIFKLGVALFDSIESKLDPTEDYPQQFIQEVTKIRRKDNVANWIRWYVASTVRNEVRSQLASNEKNIGEKNIFTFLSGGFLEEACKQAIESGDVRLATLIAQTGSGGDEEEFRLDLVDQFSVWRSGGVDAMISSDYRRIFELLSGNVTWSRGNGKREESEAVKDLKIASGLDWIRTFALFFYFDCPFGAGVEESLARYEASIGGEADIVPPLPPYLEKEIRPGSQRFRQAIRTGVYHRDVLFHLLKLFCSHEYPLENVLEPLNYGSNRLNYSIAFHISSILSKVLLDQGDGRGRDFNDRIELGFEDYDFAQSANLKGNSGKSDRLCVDYALQLETMGLWKWAAFILLHLELKQSRKENIQALLARNVDHLMLPADEEKKSKSADEEFLVDTLKIPIEWLYKAKADSACCQDNRWLEYKYLLLAKQYSTAHEVAIRFLATEGIIQHDFEFILSLFAPFQQGYNKDNDGRAEAEDTLIMQDVLGWSRGGQIYLDYIAICRSLPWLMGNIGKSHPLSHNITGGKQSATNTTNNNLMEKEEGGVAKIEKLANKIPRLIKDVRELFDGFQETVSMTVARSQMITSLYTCIRMLKSSTLVQQFNLTLHLDDDDTVSASTGSGNDKQVPVEIENLQFFANDYCSMLIGTA